MVTVYKDTQHSILGESKKYPLVIREPFSLTDIFLTHPVLEKLNSNYFQVYHVFIKGYDGYDIQEYDPSAGCFIYKLSTEDSRGYHGNFASSVCIDSGVENWCNYSKSGKKTETQDHSKQFPEHFEDDKIFLLTIN